MKYIFPLLFAVSAFFVGCSDNDTKVQDSKYYLVHRASNKVTISTYEFQSKTLTQDFYTFPPKDGAYLVDMEVKGDYGYATTYGQRILLKKIDLRNGTDVKAVNSFGPAFIEIDNDIIVTLGWGHSAPGNIYAAIKVYDQELTLLDSVADNEVSHVVSMKIFDNKLFYCVKEGSDFSIHVFDLNSKVELPSIAIPDPCVEFVPTSNKTLWAILPGKVISINTETMQVTKEWQTNEPLAQMGLQRSAALDASTNTLLYLSLHVQQGELSYLLSKFNLSTGTAEIAAKSTPIEGPMLLDQNTDMLVSITGLYSKEGERLHEFSIPVSTVLMAN